MNIHIDCNAPPATLVPSRPRYVLGALWMLVCDNEANAIRLTECGGLEHARDVLSVEMDVLMGPQHLVIGTVWSAMHSHVCDEAPCCPCSPQATFGHAHGLTRAHGISLPTRMTSEGVQGRGP